MNEEGQKLGDVLSEIGEFTIKYDFNRRDQEVLLDRLLLLGEACAMLEELGLFKELEERHGKACERYASIMEELMSSIIEELMSKL